MNIPKHVIDKKNPCKRLNVFTMKWTFKDKKFTKLFHLKPLKIYIYIYIRKVSMHFTIKFFI